ncbi:MAG: Rrf2 family transcriptional regulator [Candidatus Omnitrophota bacterium]
MKLLTKNTDYAIRALICLGSHPDEFLSAKALADSQDIPYQYLRKILQRLIHEGLVESKAGGQGGFCLKADSKSVSVTDVIRIFQGELQLSECLFRKKICANRNHCVLRKNIQAIEESVTKKFSGMTIKSLIHQMETKA